LLKTRSGDADGILPGNVRRTHPYMELPPISEHVETATMSDKPLGPGWWLASDGTWHPPELHPSMRDDTAGAAAAAAAEVAVAVADAAAGAVHGPAPVTGTATAVHGPPVPTFAAVDSLDAIARSIVTSDPATGQDPVAPVAPVDAPVVTVEMPPLGPRRPQPVPSLGDVPKRPTWSGESDRRPEAGPMFPDLFQQAVAGTALANAITVTFADGEHRESPGLPNSTSPTGDSPMLVPAGGRMPAEVGAFTGASAKKRRWRL
jgi:hypothetical protein